MASKKRVIESEKLETFYDIQEIKVIRDNLTKVCKRTLKELETFFKNIDADDKKFFTTITTLVKNLVAFKSFDDLLTSIENIFDEYQKIYTGLKENYPPQLSACICCLFDEIRHFYEAKEAIPIKILQKAEALWQTMSPISSTMYLTFNISFMTSFNSNEKSIEQWLNSLDNLDKKELLVKLLEPQLQNISALEISPKSGGWSNTLLANIKLFRPISFHFNKLYAISKQKDAQSLKIAETCQLNTILPMTQQYTINLKGYYLRYQAIITLRYLSLSLVTNKLYKAKPENLVNSLQGKTIVHNKKGTELIDRNLENTLLLLSETDHDETTQLLVTECALLLKCSNEPTQLLISNHMRRIEQQLEKNSSTSFPKDCGIEIELYKKIFAIINYYDADNDTIIDLFVDRIKEHRKKHPESILYLAFPLVCHTSKLYPKAVQLPNRLKDNLYVSLDYLKEACAIFEPFLQENKIILNIENQKHCEATFNILASAEILAQSFYRLAKKELFTITTAIPKDTEMRTVEKLKLYANNTLYQEYIYRAIEIREQILAFILDTLVQKFNQFTLKPWVGLKENMFKLEYLQQMPIAILRSLNEKYLQNYKDEAKNFDKTKQELEFNLIAEENKIITSISDTEITTQKKKSKKKKAKNKGVLSLAMDNKKEINQSSERDNASDRLNNAEQHSNSAPTKINLIGKAAEHLIKGDVSVALDAYTNIIATAKKNKNSLLEAECVLATAHIHWMQGNSIVRQKFSTNQSKALGLFNQARKRCRDALLLVRSDSDAERNVSNKLELAESIKFLSQSIKYSIKTLNSKTAERSEQATIQNEQSKKSVRTIAKQENSFKADQNFQTQNYENSLKDRISFQNTLEIIDKENLNKECAILVDETSENLKQLSSQLPPLGAPIIEYTICNTPEEKWFEQQKEKAIQIFKDILFKDENNNFALLVNFLKSNNVQNKYFLKLYGSLTVFSLWHESVEGRDIDLVTNIPSHLLSNYLELKQNRNITQFILWEVKGAKNRISIKYHYVNSFSDIPPNDATCHSVYYDLINDKFDFSHTTAVHDIFNKIVRVLPDPSHNLTVEQRLETHTDSHGDYVGYKLLIRTLYNAVNYNSKILDMHQDHIRIILAHISQENRGILQPEDLYYWLVFKFLSPKNAKKTFSLLTSDSFISTALSKLLFGSNFVKLPLLQKNKSVIQEKISENSELYKNHPYEHYRHFISIIFAYSYSVSTNFDVIINKLFLVSHSSVARYNIESKEAIRHHIASIHQKYNSNSEKTSLRLDPVEIFTDKLNKGENNCLNFNTAYNLNVITFLNQSLSANQNLSFILFEPFRDDSDDFLNNYVKYVENAQTKSLLDGKPVCFICKEPETVMHNTDHYLGIVIYQKNLLCINPLGLRYQKNFIDILRELQKKKIINHVVFTDEILQNPLVEAEGDVSSGPISIEIFFSILALDTLNFNTFLSEVIQKNLKIYDIETGQAYHLMNLKYLIPQCTIFKIENAAFQHNYVEYLLQIRKNHFDHLNRYYHQNAVVASNSSASTADTTDIVVQLATPNPAHVRQTIFYSAPQNTSDQLPQAAAPQADNS